MPPKKATSNAVSTANMTRKRKAVEIDEEEKENVPATKKIKGTTTKARNTRSTAKKPAPASKAVPKSKATVTKTKETISTKKTGLKRKASDDIEDEPAAKKKNAPTKAIPKKATATKTTTTKAAAQKTTTSKAAPKKAAAQKTITSKAAPKKAAPQKAAPQKTAASKAAPKKSAPQKTTASKASSTKAVPQKTTASKAAPKKAAAQKTITSKAAPKKAAPQKAAPQKTTASKASSTKAVPQKTTASKAAPKKATPEPKAVVDPVTKVKTGVQINNAPTDPLDIFVFGEGSAGELGLGARKIDGKKPIDVKRPRLNPLLSAEDVGVVQMACGGMHVIALTKDNKILTWGVNDQGALGRDTTWNGGMVDADAAAGAAQQSGSGDDEDEDEDDDSGLNPRESTPTEINTKYFAPGTKFVQVAACDSASFALTEDGRVYSWGTFRSGDGILGFSKDVEVQQYPVLLDEPKKVITIATGSNHVLTLDNKGKIQAWGAPEQNQLARRCVQRDMKASCLRPGGVAFKRGVKITKIAAGSYHSFALDDKGQVWAWGLNNYGQLGIQNENVGDDGAVILQPTLVEQLADHKIVDIIGGEHHTLAITDDGQVLSFGRIDGNQLGFPKDYYNRDNSIFGVEREEPRVLKAPTRLELPAIVAADAGVDTNLAITQEGRVYSWGFNDNYQCGIGDTAGDVITPVLVDNSVVRDRKIVFVGCGGQFGILGSVHE